MPDDVTRDAEAFASRHIGPSAPEVDAMLATLGMASLDELIDRAVPEAIRDRTPLGLPDGLTEAEAKGTPRTRRTSPRSRRAGSRRSSTSRPW
jgi:glycine cleavage system pyridoxal-binding protein P